jgi:hypothetical protein
MTDVDVPFAVPSSTQFAPLPPNVNSKPNIIIDGKNGMNTVIVITWKISIAVTKPISSRLLSITGSVKVSKNELSTDLPSSSIRSSSYNVPCHYIRDFSYAASPCKVSIFIILKVCRPQF